MKEYLKYYFCLFTKILTYSLEKGNGSLSVWEKKSLVLQGHLSPSAVLHQT